MGGTEEVILSTHSFIKMRNRLKQQVSDLNYHETTKYLSQSVVEDIIDAKSRHALKGKDIT